MQLVMLGYFLVMFIDLDYDGKYNILLEEKDSKNLISLRIESVPFFKEGEIIKFRIEAECDKNKVGEVLEGNGKIGSPWIAEDDWYLNKMTHICNSKKMEILND